MHGISQCDLLQTTGRELKQGIHPQPTRQAMGDEQHGHFAAQAVNGFGKLFGRRRVQGAGGFIEHQDFGAFEQGARNGNALPLTTRKTGTAFADLGLVAIRQGFDGAVDFGQFAGCDDLLKVGLRTGHLQIVQNGAGKEHGLLWHHPKVAAQFIGGQVGDVNAVNLDAPFSRLVKPLKQFGQRTFAAARGPHDGNGLARYQLRIQILVQHGQFVAVAKGQVLQLDGAMAGLHPLWR